MTSDLHTHRSKGGVFELVSTTVPENCIYPSLEVHPWNLPESFTAFDDEFIARAKKCSAIGEIGLDRLRGPELAVQRRYFDALLDIADALAKPVVIHCVRCDAELMHSLAGFRQNVLIHGFNGGVGKLERYLDAGFFVSFSNLKNKDVISFLQKNGLKNTGLETDDLDCDIEYIAGNIASALGIPVEDINANSLETFKRLLSI